MLFHGEPTWSYLWRTVVPPLLEAGLRCVDLPGFRRSDRPTDVGWCAYDRHVAAMTALLEALDVRDATSVVRTGAARSALRVASSGPHAARGSPPWTRGSSWGASA